MTSSQWIKLDFTLNGFIKKKKGRMIETFIFTIIMIVPTIFMLNYGLNDRKKLNCGDNCECFEKGK